VVFWTRPNESATRPLAPRITINLTLPDGRRFAKFYDTTADQFTASKEGCDVPIGTSRLVGDFVATASRLPLRKYLSRSN